VLQQFLTGALQHHSPGLQHVGSISVLERGRLVLPAPLRQRLGLQPGDRLIATLDPEGGFKVVSAREQARRLYGLYRDLVPGRSLANELIAERQSEPGREDAP
jgi:AbrB family looped-hinge helix DNA binding protein